MRWWRDHPPTNEILLAVHRAPGAADKPADPADPSNIGALLARHPDGVVKSMT